MDILNIFFKNPLKQQFIIKKKKSGLKKSSKIWKSERTINFKYGANSNNRFFYDNESC